MRQSETMYNCLYFLHRKFWLKEALCKLLQVLQFESPCATLTLNLSNCLFFVVTWSNLLMLLPTKILTQYGKENFYKINLFIITTNKIKVIAQKKDMSKSNRINTIDSLICKAKIFQYNISINTTIRITSHPEVFLG